MLRIVTVPRDEAEGVVCMGIPLGVGRWLEPIHPLYLLAVIRQDIEAIKSDGWEIVPGAVAYSVTVVEELGMAMQMDTSRQRPVAQALVAVTSAERMPSGCVYYGGCVIGLTAARMYPHIDAETPVLSGRFQLDGAVSAALAELPWLDGTVPPAGAVTEVVPELPDPDDTAVFGDSKKVAG